MTNVIDNSGDKIFTTIWPNPSRETVILLHGGPGFPDDLLDTVELLKRDFQLITFHQRGTKKSACQSKDYSMDAYISDIDSVADFYNLSAFHLFGHSWGGLYAQIYCQKYPEKLLSLFLCCPGSGTNSEWRQTEKEVMQFNKSKCNTWEWSKMGMNSLLGMVGSNKAYRRIFMQVIKNYNDGLVDASNLNFDFDNLTADAINSTRPEIVKYPLLQKQENLPFRVTIVYGERDIYGRSKEYVINRYPSATVITIPQSGHLPWWHNPQMYTQVVDRHFKF